MFREIVSASTSEAWIVLTPASIDKITKNACRHFAKNGHIYLPPLIAFTKSKHVVFLFSTFGTLLRKTVPSYVLNFNSLWTRRKRDRIWKIRPQRMDDFLL